MVPVRRVQHQAGLRLALACKPTGWVRMARVGYPTMAIASVTSML